MEKTLLKKHYKRGEFAINYLPKTLVFGVVATHDSYMYLCLGPISFEWFSYKKK